MKKIVLLLFCGGLFLFSGCLKQKFIPDPDDPGLSSFTYKHIQTGTCYINDSPYINFWPVLGLNFSLAGLPYPRFSKHSSSLADSIDFSWPIGASVNGKYNPSEYSDLVFRIPVSSNQTLENINRLTEQRIFGARLWLNQKEGIGNVYFVKIELNKNDSSFLNMAGLFDGNIGDSIYIKKGRFDYVVKTTGF